MRKKAVSTEPPLVLIKWYDVTGWMLGRIDNFPKNQRFIFGHRLADYVLAVLELLVEASYTSNKADILARANEKIEIIRWLVRLAHDRRLLSVRQYMYVSELLTECGRMVGGWLKKCSHKRQSDAPGKEPV